MDEFPDSLDFIADARSDFVEFYALATPKDAGLASNSGNVAVSSAGSSVNSRRRKRAIASRSVVSSLSCAPRRRASSARSRSAFSCQSFGFMRRIEAGRRGASSVQMNTCRKVIHKVERIGRGDSGIIVEPAVLLRRGLMATSRSPRWVHSGPPAMILGDVQEQGIESEGSALVSELRGGSAIPGAGGVIRNVGTFPESSAAHSVIIAAA